MTKRRLIASALALFLAPTVVPQASGPPFAHGTQTVFASPQKVEAFCLFEIFTANLISDLAANGDLLLSIPLGTGYSVPLPEFNDSFRAAYTNKYAIPLVTAPLGSSIASHASGMVYRGGITGTRFYLGLAELCKMEHLLLSYGTAPIGSLMPVEDRCCFRHLLALVANEGFHMAQGDLIATESLLSVNTENIANMCALSGVNPGERPAFIEDQTNAAAAMSAYLEEMASTLPDMAARAMLAVWAGDCYAASPDLITTEGIFQAIIGVPLDNIQAALATMGKLALEVSTDPNLNVPIFPAAAPVLSEAELFLAQLCGMGQQAAAILATALLLNL